MDVHHIWLVQLWSTVIIAIMVLSVLVNVFRISTL